MSQNEERGTEVTIPHLAESLVSATVAKWLKHPGDYVKEYDTICELLTDKVNVEMPSPIEGTIIRIFLKEGESAAVGTSICLIQEPDSRLEFVADTHKETELKANETVESGEHSARFSPAVLRLAEEHRIQLQQVKGTGLGGRITRKDVTAYVKNRVDVSNAVPPDQSPLKKDEVSVDRVKAADSVPAALEQTEPEATMKSPGDHSHPVTILRSMIASRMRQSVSEIPHAWMMIEADVSHLVTLRQKLKEGFLSKEGAPLTFTPFVLKAIVNAIKDYPILNSTWASGKIIVKKDINLSIAVGSEDSVVTPVILNSDRKTIAGLAIELHELVMRARSGKLILSDMQGGSFTFNNTGSFGSILSYPIINYPQAAIITFESIVRKPVVIQEMIAIRSIANLCLSFDHRILDGMICGQFMQRVKQYLEQYKSDTIIY